MDGCSRNRSVPADRTAGASPGGLFGGPRPRIVAPPGTGADLEHDGGRVLADISTPDGVRAGLVLRIAARTQAAPDATAPDAVVVASIDPGTIAGLRRRHAVPVVVDLGERPELAAVAVAAGADGLWLDTPSAAAVGQAREAAARLAPLVRPALPDSLAGCREAIDTVDAVLATLLEHRVALAGRVQRLKPVGGHAGRDPEREAAIVAAMATRAPSLPPAQLGRIMGAVIEAGLDVAERDISGEPPVWRL